MLFNSLEFAIFFPLVLGLYLCLRKRAQNLMLLAASYVFYGMWDWRFLSLLLLSTVIDYTCARAIANAPDARRRRTWLIASVCVNLGILGFFKYFNFFAGSMVDLLKSFGLNADTPTLQIILPVGISFYTFQTMSYVIDVYRGQLEARRNFFDFALFVSFFPQLVAGPIERASSLLPQVENDRKPTLDGFYSGCYLMAWGLFKKVFIADNLARYVEPAFAAGAAPDGATVLLAVYAFTFQIYCDFSGYSDIARGCARCLGFELMVNFNLPYIATNPRDFWRRWHISLSTWLRDYLYIPLGGNRGDRWHVNRNLLLTMTLGGLWHGANWVFVLWGAYHGTLLILHRALEPYLRKLQPTSRPSRWGWWLMRWLVWFHLVCLGWLFFRADSIGQVAALLNSLAAGVVFTPSAMMTAAYMLFYLGFLIVVQILQARREDLIIPLRWPWPVRSICYAYLFYAVVIFGAMDRREFIYFQF
jgi:alginate O-acetyltransferase complex protein AlgI